MFQAFGRRDQAFASVAPARWTISPVSHTARLPPVAGLPTQSMPASRHRLSCSEHIQCNEKERVIGMQDLIGKMPGVISTHVGYSGGDVPNATYRNHGTSGGGCRSNRT
jgi:hypothetical protein